MEKDKLEQLMEEAKIIGTHGAKIGGVVKEIGEDKYNQIKKEYAQLKKDHLVLAEKMRKYGPPAVIFGTGVAVGLLYDKLKGNKQLTA